MRHARSGLPFLFAGVLAAGSFLLANAAEPKKPTQAKPEAARETPGLPAPDYLSEPARALLRKKMGRHGADAKELMFAVTLLRYDVARAAAQRIASEPRLERPTAGGEDDLNAALPERFFLLQDEIRMRAQAVSAAAGKHDDKAIAESYGLLVQTCVSCHSAYLKHE